MKNAILLLLLPLILPACHTAPKTGTAPASLYETTEDSLTLFDTARNRLIPVALYLPKTSNKIRHQKLVIFSHGYGANEPGANRAYTYLTEMLAAQGCFVASIQHELPTDSLLAMSGDFRVTRRPNWERGAQNIKFVLYRLKTLHPELDYRHLILSGHSNGGDMSMLFAQLYPDLVGKVISLDNKRMPFPRAARPRVYSLRADDDPADPGVLPTPYEQKKYGIKIIYLKGIKHGDMSSYGTAEQHRTIEAQVLAFLRD